MNKAYVLSNLKEAHEQLEELIVALNSDPSYEYGDFLADMSHLYHHINTAWNARDASESSVEKCSEEDFQRWRTMPEAQELLLVP